MLIESPVLLFVSNATAFVILVCCGGFAALITEVRMELIECSCKCAAIMLERDMFCKSHASSFS